MNFYNLTEFMEGIKTYKIMELVKKTWFAKQTIHKRDYEYIPVLMEDVWTRARFRAGKQETPYRREYIKVTDVIKYIKTNTWKELVFKWEEKNLNATSSKPGRKGKKWN